MEQPHQAISNGQVPLEIIHNNDNNNNQQQHSNNNSNNHGNLTPPPVVPTTSIQMQINQHAPIPPMHYMDPHAIASGMVPQAMMIDAGLLPGVRPPGMMPGGKAAKEQRIKRPMNAFMVSICI